MGRSRGAAQEGLADFEDLIAYDGSSQQPSWRPPALLSAWCVLGSALGFGAVGSGQTQFIFFLPLPPWS